MSKPISPVFARMVEEAPFGSDVHSIRKRIELMELGNAEEYLPGRFRKACGRFNPLDQATQILCYAMGEFYGWDVAPRGAFPIFPVDSALSNTIGGAAYRIWQKRQQLGVGGNEGSDWEHALGLVAGKFVVLYEDSLKREVFKSSSV